MSSSIRIRISSLGRDPNTISTRASAEDTTTSASGYGLEGDYDVWEAYNRGRDEDDESDEGSFDTWIEDEYSDGPKPPRFMWRVLSYIFYFLFAPKTETVQRAVVAEHNDGDKPPGFVRRILSVVFSFVFSSGVDPAPDSNLDEYSDSSKPPGLLSRTLSYILSLLVPPEIDPSHGATFRESNDVDKSPGRFRRGLDYLYSFRFPSISNLLSRSSNADISVLNTEPTIDDTTSLPTPSSFLSPTSPLFPLPSSPPFLPIHPSPPRYLPLPPPPTLTLHLSIFSATKFPLYPKKHPYWMTIYSDISPSMTISQLKRMFISDFAFLLMRAGGDMHLGSKGLKIRAGGRWLRHGGRGIGEELGGGGGDWVGVGVVVLGSRGEEEVEKGGDVGGMSGGGKKRKGEVPQELVDEVDGITGARPGWPFRGEVRMPGDRREWVANPKLEFPLPL